MACSHNPTSGLVFGDKGEKLVVIVFGRNGKATSTGVVSSCDSTVEFVVEGKKITRRPGEITLEVSGITASGTNTVSVDDHSVNTIGQQSDFTQDNCPVSSVKLDGVNTPVIQSVHCGDGTTYLFYSTSNVLRIFPNTAQFIKRSLKNCDIIVERGDSSIGDAVSYKIKIVRESKTTTIEGKSLTYSGLNVVLCESIDELLRLAKTDVPAEITPVASGNSFASRVGGQPPKPVSRPVKQAPKPASKPDDGFIVQKKAGFSKICFKCNEKEGKSINGKASLCLACALGDGNMFGVRDNGEFLTAFPLKDSCYNALRKEIAAKVSWEHFNLMAFLQNNYNDQFEALKNKIFNTTRQN
jgi:hypothetical protein